MALLPVNRLLDSGCRLPGAKILRSVVLPGRTGGLRCIPNRDSRSRTKRFVLICKAAPEARQGRIVSKNPTQSSASLHKPVGLVLFSAWFLGAVSQLTGFPGAHYVPFLFGGALGGFFASLDRYCVVRLWKEPPSPIRVVVTGGTKGLGKALAREFLRQGDVVLLTGRTEEGVQQATQQLRQEVGQDVTVHGCACDVADSNSVAGLTAAVQNTLGGVDVWINNAGYSGSFQSFTDASDDTIAQVVRTNLLGTLLCCRAAAEVMQQQEQQGHIFNMDGAGADGFPTPQYAAYGATKCAIAQLMGSLVAELEDSPVSIHTLSPGMMLTDLLLEGATQQNKNVFNILCEQPETVAAFLVPRVRTVVANGGSGKYIKYLTPLSVVHRLLTAPARVNRFFDADGKALYASEHERILGQKAKATERAAANARKRSHGLQFAYSLSLALSVLVMVVEATNARSS